MKLRVVSCVMLVLLSTGLLSLAYNIQSVKAVGTIYIRADGSIDPPTANITTIDHVTYTFIDNIMYESIVIERDNIVVDGLSHTLEGVWGFYAGVGINLTGRNNVTIKNLIIREFEVGIQLTHSFNNIICDNYVATCLSRCIWLYNSSGNLIERNDVVREGDTRLGQGIGLAYSGSNVLRNNTMTFFTSNFEVQGRYISDYMNDVDTSNTVDGKPIYYWVNKQDMMVPSDAGCVVLANCTRIVARNLNLVNNNAGVLLAFTTNSIVAESNMLRNFQGIWITTSSHNIICRNNVTDNTCGVYVSSNFGSVGPEKSSNNNVYGNNIRNNLKGIEIRVSSNNTIFGNDITENQADGIYFWYSSDFNNVIRNEITHNGWGIRLWSSSHNSIHHNSFVNNTVQVHVYDLTNTWDDGYPSGGNYWSDYAGVDNSTPPDGIGDTPYFIDGYNQDNYPLMNPNWNPADINHDWKVDIKDIATAALAYGSFIGYDRWNPAADITGRVYLVPDSKVDIRDIALICKHFGETYTGEITLLDDRFDTGLDNWVYWGGPGYVLEWASNAAKISGDHNWPPLVDCGMQKVVDLSTWGEHGTLLLSFDWRAASSYSSSCTTNARLWIQDADSNSSLLFLDLISGGTLDTGWQAYSGDISPYVTGHSNIRIILYLMDNYAANYDQTNFYDNIKLEVSGN